MVVSILKGPVPGQSLASGKPGERSWERPPQLNSVEETLSFYMNRLSKQEIIDDFMIVLESGIAIKPLVESLYMASVMRGIHSLDVGLLVAPALMEFFAAVADSYGVEYKFSNRNVKKEMEDKERARMSLLISSAIQKAKEEGTADAGTQVLEQMAAYLETDMTREETEEAVAEEQPPEPVDFQDATMEQPPAEPQEQGQGLMARG